MSEEFAHLVEQVKKFPTKPGVYLMKDEQGRVIYVGKAKSLRARVRSYFNGADERAQISFLLKRIAVIDKIVTHNEQQALVLERDLIAQYKPRYNIKLKDDKTYLSVRLDERAAWPRLELVRRRGEEDAGVRYFGPYAYSYQLRELLEVVKRVVPLRSCSDTVFHNRTRPCLEYQIKRCAGPCCLKVEGQQYRAWVKQAIALLEGRIQPLIKDIDQQMDKASEELRFEDAAVLRDRIDVLKKLSEGASVVSSKGEHRDVVALYREGMLASLAFIHVRDGRIRESDNFTLPEVFISDEELLQEALLQYFDGHRELPEEILLPLPLTDTELVQGMITERYGKKVVLTTPERGVNKRLVELCEVNAREHFQSVFNEDDRYKSLARELRDLCSLQQIPRRIECVDISHFQGAETVGAVVCYIDGVPAKDKYRKYTIDNGGKSDDFASINEVVGRRLERGMAEEDLPDLLIIDGGLGQLRMALEAKEALGAPVEIVALAKMRTEQDLQSTDLVRSSERIFCPGDSEPRVLPEGKELTNFIVRVRDEVHRFVISFHRKKRGAAALKSQLDQILGVGAMRRTRLLSHFGSLEGIAKAEVGELARVGRMPLALAEKILRKLGE